MKNLVLFLTLIATSQSAFAFNWLSFHCDAKTIQGETISIGQDGDPLKDPSVSSDKLTGDGPYLVKWDTTFNDQAQDQDFALILKLVKPKVVTQEKSIKQGTCVTEAETSVQTLDVVKASKEVQKALGLRKGQRLVFVCYNGFLRNAIGADSCHE